MTIAIINGPNLNLLGKREPDIYGKKSLEQLQTEIKTNFPEHQFIFFQSNKEGELIDKLHETGFSADGIILNAGAYTHTSLALADAISAISSPVIEVHLSQIFARESIRHKSLIAPACIGSVSGFGFYSYIMATQYFIDAF